MNKVVIDMTVSLDGFVAGPGDSWARLRSLADGGTPYRSVSNDGATA
jgi:hypothetical protein